MPRSHQEPEKNRKEQVNHAMPDLAQQMRRNRTRANWALVLGSVSLIINGAALYLQLTGRLP